MSATKRLVRNGLAAILHKGVKLLDQLILVPFFITAWGVAYYGEWLTLTIVPTIIGFSDLGFGTAAATAFALKYAANDKQEAANISASGLTAITVIVFAGVCLSTLVIFVGGHFEVFEKSLIIKDQAVLAVSMLMASRIIVFYNQLYEAYYTAARNASLGILLQSIYSIAVLACSIAVLLGGGGIVALSLVILVITILYTVLYISVARKVLPLHKEYKGVVQLEGIKKIFNKGFGYLLSPVWQALYFQGTTVVVRVVLGPVAVTIFNTVRTVTRAVNQCYSMVITATISELQFEIGAGNYEKARKIFRMGLALIFSVGLVGVVALAVLGPWMYELWTRKLLTPPPMMWNILILGILFNAVWWPASFVFQVMNRPYEFSIAGTICAAVSVCASYFLADRFGLNGVALGSLAMDVMLAFLLLPKACKLLNQPLVKLVPDIAGDFKALLRRKVKGVAS